MRDKYVLSIDCGTQSIRALIIHSYMIIIHNPMYLGYN